MENIATLYEYYAHYEYNVIVRSAENSFALLGTVWQSNRVNGINQILATEKIYKTDVMRVFREDVKIDLTVKVFREEARACLVVLVLRN